MAVAAETFTPSATIGLSNNFADFQYDYEKLDQPPLHLWPETIVETLPPPSAISAQCLQSLVYGEIDSATGSSAPVVMVAETLQDESTRRRTARFIGACLVKPTLESPSSNDDPEALFIKPIESLLDAAKLANRGDAVARQMVETNVATDVIERTIKTGHIMSVDLMVDAAGRIQQFGQSMESVQANSLRYAANTWQMRQRTEAETLNTFRIDAAYKAGSLQDYSFVVVSRAADNMTKSEMNKQGFFTETMSCAIQVTSASGNHLVTESAFVSGVTADGHQHDATTVAGMYAELGVDITGKTAAEVIATPLLIHNSLIPNGVVDIVKLYDQAAGGTFFGEDQPLQDYQAYRQKCHARTAAFEPIVQEITNELIAVAPSLTSKVDAAMKLAKLSEARMVEHAVKDVAIDLRVFGATSAQHIANSRAMIADGDRYGAQIELAFAKKTAQSSSCPGGVKSDSADGSSETDDDCEFISKACPICGEKNVKTTVTKDRISGDCGCSVKRDKPVIATIAASPQSDFGLAA